MRGVFDEEEPEHPRREAELTLGSGMLLGVIFGLVLICGVCFGLGYAVGRRGSSAPAVPLQAASGAQSVLQGDGSHFKPSANAMPTAAPQHSTPDQPPNDSASASQTEQPAAQSLVQAALPSTPIRQPLTQAGRVQPAIAPAAPMMVQIAAVANPEDADVLVNALRKHGYAVSARHDAVDGLIHVRIGPFANRNDAIAMRQKLLSDGYNAMLQ
jgi:cell division septation protein DedD